MNRRRHKPLVYSCSGCSSAAQLANAAALKLDRAGVAEMSCIAGVGGDVPSLVRTARSGRPVVAIDGCALACVKNTLARHGVAPRLTMVLSEFGVRKRYRTDFDATQAQSVFEALRTGIVQALPGSPSAVAARPALLRPRPEVDQTREAA